VDIDIDVDHPILSDPRWNDIPTAKRLNSLFKARKQIGTSGGGNHFVEFGIIKHKNQPEVQRLAVLSHSGSRGVGYNLATHFTEVAMNECKLQNDAKRLAWLEMDSDSGREYWEAMQLSGAFAEACHDVIHQRIVKALGVHKIEMYSNHHNFAWKQKVDGKDAIVHRKGATPAALNQIGIIPGSMTTSTYLVKGKGNPNSMSSSSHGAGRAMSRTIAKQTYTMTDLRANLEAAGVTLIGGSVDECSMGYKDIHSVMEAQKDLVDIVAEFQPIVVRMAGEQLKPWEKECGE
jgi:tRNA-splicing ligase RtcB